MMMVVPIDPEIDETEYIAQEMRQQWFQCREVNCMRYLHFQYHYRDDNGQDAVAERFKPRGFHLTILARVD
jgi:hypothetical protein